MFGIRTATTLVAALAALGALIGGARADYPERQITLVACFPAGGGTDIAARLINTALGERLGKPVIVENRGGAGGNIGTAAVARSAPDGYTLLICSSAFVVNPSLYAKVAYDPFKDFVPIMVLGASPNVFVLPPQSKFTSLKEVIAQAKANPGKLNWTSPGAGTTPYLAGELLKQRTGIEMQHIPFAGAGPATNAVLGGQVDLYTANIGSLVGLISAGKVRPVAVTSAQALAGPAGRADAGGGRRQGRRVRHVPGHLRARRHAAADRRPAGQGACRRAGAAGHQGKVRQDRPAGGGRRARRRSAPASPRRCRCTRRSSTRPG